MGTIDSIKSVFPVSSRSAHAMYREIGEMHHELAELRAVVDSLQRDVESNHEKISLMLWGAICREGESASDAKKRFFREMAPATGLMRLRQEASLKLLEGFMSFCAENDLHYWLAQGSLLGAVRHGGYIPWDDDLDVGMTRQELQRAKDAIVGSSEYRITECFDYCVHCRQVRFRYADEAIPLFIDIFIYDPVGKVDAATLERRESGRAFLVDGLSSNEELRYWNEGNQFIVCSDSKSAPIALAFDEINSSLYDDGTYVIDIDSADGFMWAVDNVDSGVDEFRHILANNVLVLTKEVSGFRLAPVE